tara:strand:+ start:4798 stop:5079 length:282 start_codon:yes stop_codon:yes gene_type:complete
MTVNKTSKSSSKRSAPIRKIIPSKAVITKFTLLYRIYAVGTVNIINVVIGKSKSRCISSVARTEAKTPVIPNPKINGVAMQWIMHKPEQTIPK